MYIRRWLWLVPFTLLLALVLLPRQAQSTAPLQRLEDGGPTVITPSGHFETPFLLSSGSGVLPVGENIVFGSATARSNDDGALWYITDYPTYTVNAYAVAPEFPDDPFLFRAIGYGGPLQDSGANQVIYSPDGGITWHEPVTPPTGFINRLVTSPNFSYNRTVYALPYNAPTLWVSHDAGVTWESRALPTASGTQLLVAPTSTQDSEILYLRGENNRIYRSEDDGLTWELSDSGLLAPPGNRVYDVAVSPRFYNDKTLFAATRFGLYRTTDAGDTWVVTNADSALMDVEIPTDYDQSSNPRLFGRSAFVYSDEPDYPNPDDVVLITDNGTTINATTFPSSVEHTALSSRVLANGQVKLFVSSYPYALWISNDSGTSWYQSARQLLFFEDLYAAEVAVSPHFEKDEKAVVSLTIEGHYGLLMTHNAGETWESLPLPEDSNTVRFAFSSNFATDHTLFLATYSHMYRSADEGHTWELVGDAPMPSSTYSDQAMRVSPNFGEDRTIFMIGYDGLYRSENAGDTWERLDEDPLYGVTDVELSPDFTTDATLYYHAYGQAALRVSVDGGDTFTDTSPIPLSRSDIALSPNFANDQTIYVRELGNSDGGLYRSEDGGDSWVSLHDAATGFYGTMLSISPNYATDHTVLTGRQGTGVFLSEDKGETWTLLPSLNAYSSLTRSATEYYHDKLFVFLVDRSGIFRYAYPKLEVPSDLTIYIPPGSMDIQTVTLPLQTDFYAAAPWQATENAAWLTTSPLSGTLPGNLNLIVDPGLLSGPTSTTVTIEASWLTYQNDTASIDIHITNQPPTPIPTVTASPTVTTTPSPTPTSTGTPVASPTATPSDMSSLFLPLIQR